MIGATFLVLVFLASSAYSAKISIDKACSVPTSCPLHLKTGMTEKLTFKLDEPIICPVQDETCSVVVLITNTDPNSVSTDTCMVKWLAHEWSQKRTVTVTAVEKFVNDRERSLYLIMKPAISKSEYYSNFTAPSVFIKSTTLPSSQCSGTGDPHYTTFDKAVWHQYAPGNLVFYKSTVPGRDFEIQTRMRKARSDLPAVNCGVAGIEGNDLVIIDYCEGSLKIVPRITSPPGKGPKISWVGTTYTVVFPSGASFTCGIVPSGYLIPYMNVYATAPGIDYGHTAGLCGNNNQNPADDVPGYYGNIVISDFTKLFPSMIPTRDLWFWQPPAVIPPPDALPPYAKECNYTEPIIKTPTLIFPDAEDITDLIKQIADSQDEELKNFEFEADPTGLPASETVSEAVARAACEKYILSSSVAQACATVAGVNLETYVFGCIEDVQLTGDDSFVTDAARALEAECKTKALTDQSTWTKDEDGNPVAPDPSLTNLLCPDDCNGHGTCVKGVCSCTSPYKGGACEYNPTEAPAIMALSSVSCDARGVNGCPARISVTVTNLFKSDSLTCKFGSELTTAVYVGVSTVVCTVPSRVHTGAQEETVAVSVSNDGTVFSTGAFSFTWYDSACQVCTGNDCSPNTQSCTINGVCYEAGAVSDANMCKTCQPSVSSSSFSYSYGNAHVCGPQFAEKSYVKTIVEKADANVVILTVSAGNALVAADSTNKVTYSLLPTAVVPPFNVSATTGDVFTTTAVVYNQMPLGQKSVMFEIVASDSHGNTAIVSVRIDVLATNQKPLLPESFTTSIKEDAAVNTAVLSINATDADGVGPDGTNWGKITYSIFYEENGYAGVFGIDATTGRITVQQPLDYETKKSYILQVRAVDGGGSWFTTDVNINVLNVQEKPSDILLSSTLIAENQPAQTVVGTLTSKDPEGGTFTYSLVGNSGPFVIVGSQLKATMPLNYEATPNEYSVTVRSTDSTNLFFDKTFTIKVGDVNEAPFNVQLSKTTFGEDSVVGSRLADVTYEDPDVGQAGSCSLSSSAGGVFEINNKFLVLLKKLDFETAPQLSISIVCADVGEPSLFSASTPFTITVTNANDAPEDVTFTSTVSLKEDAVPQTVGSVTANDHDSDGGDMTFSIIGNSKFATGTPSCTVLAGGKGSTCTVPIKLVGALDYEQYPEEQLVLEAKDNKGLASKTTITVPVANVNEAPYGVVLDVSEVTERSPAGTLVGRIMVQDPDQGSTFTVELLDGETSAFKVVQEDVRRAIQHSLVVKDSSKLDHQVAPTQTISLRVSDGEFTRTFTTVITIADKAMTLTAPAALSVVEASTSALAGTVQLNDFDVRSLYTVSFKIEGASSFKVVPRPVSADASVPVLVDVYPKEKLDFENVAKHTITVVASFAGKAAGAAAVAVVSASFDIAVTDVDEAPVFNLVVPQITIGDDQAAGKVQQVTAVDPEGDAVAYSLATADTKLFSIDATTGNVFLKKSPTEANEKRKSFTITVTATSKGKSTSVSVPVTVQDNCYGSPCQNGGVCTDKVASYSCKCVGGYTGTSCETVDVTFKGDASTAGSSSTGLVVGLVVGILLLLLIVVAVFIIVVRRRKTQPAVGAGASMFGNPADVDYASNPMYNCPPVREDPTYSDVEPTMAFTPGVANPLYSWYTPEMTRQECDEYLMRQGEGAFVVRDSPATPGWHVLGVKTRNQVVHDKIKLDTDGMYELLPSTSASKQPKFHDIPELVEHYASSQGSNSPYTLAFNNPIYDNHQLKNVKNTPVNFQTEADAPDVPAHERNRLVINYDV